MRTAPQSCETHSLPSFHCVGRETRPVAGLRQYTVYPVHGVTSTCKARSLPPYGVVHRVGAVAQLPGVTRMLPAVYVERRIRSTPEPFQRLHAVAVNRTPPLDTTRCRLCAQRYRVSTLQELVQTMPPKPLRRVLSNAWGNRITSRLLDEEGSYRLVAKRHQPPSVTVQAVTSFPLYGSQLATRKTKAGALATSVRSDKASWTRCLTIPPQPAHEQPPSHATVTCRAPPSGHTP
jgi:hypothetical protein